MKDDSVRNCYDCEVSFSTFVRKHHCRICGRIFCAKSPHFCSFLTEQMYSKHNLAGSNSQRREYARLHILL